MTAPAAPLSVALLPPCYAMDYEFMRGCLAVDLVAVAVAIRDLVAGLPGFPDVRLGWSPYRDISHVVEWGGRPPPGDDVERGLFYGYHPDAIAAFVRERSPHPTREGATRP